MKKAIINGELFIGNKFYKEKVLIFEDDKIVDILDEETFKKDGAKIETIDANGSYVTPGFIDLQLNGCGGVLFNDDISKETIETMYKTNLKSGCTSFTPTLITTSDENILKAISVVENLDKEKIWCHRIAYRGTIYQSRKERNT